MKFLELERFRKNVPVCMCSYVCVCMWVKIQRTVLIPVGDTEEEDLTEIETRFY